MHRRLPVSANQQQQQQQQQQRWQLNND